MKTRSLVGKVFISPKPSTGNQFSQREERKRKELMSHIIAEGETQGKETDLAILL